MTAALCKDDRVDTEGRLAIASTASDDALPHIGPIRKFLGSDAGMGSLSLLGQMVVSGGNFLMLAIISWVSTKHEVGQFALAWTFVNFLRTAQERAISAPYVVFASRKETDAVTFLGSSLIHQTVFSLLSAILLLGTAGFFYWQGNAGLALVLLSSAIALPAILLREQIRVFSSTHFRFVLLLAMDISVTGLQVGLISAIMYSESFPIAIAPLAVGLACLIPSSIWLIRRPEKFRIDSIQVWLDWGRCWEYSRWLLVSRFIGIGGYLAIPWIIYYSHGEESAGVFAVANNLVGLSLMFVMGCNSFFYPRTVKDFNEGGVPAMRRRIILTIATFASVLSIISFGAFALGGPILSFVYGDHYGAYGMLVFILSLSTLSVSTSMAFANGLASLGKSKAYFVGELGCFVATMFSALFLIPTWGLNGAAAALVCGGLAASVISGWKLSTEISKYSAALDAEKNDVGVPLTCPP